MESSASIPTVAKRPLEDDERNEVGVPPPASDGKRPRLASPSSATGTGTASFLAESVPVIVDCQVDWKDWLAGYSVGRPAPPRPASSLSGTSTSDAGSGSVDGTANRYSTPSSSSSTPLPPTASHHRRERQPSHRGLTDVTRPQPTPAATPVSQLSREEAFYRTNGWLAPPSPPTEVARQRAIYRTNILKTNSTEVFYKISELCADFFKADFASCVIADRDSFPPIGRSRLDVGGNCPRDISICAHTILIPEPGGAMVVLDTQRDWRFEKSPMALGDGTVPGVRFYAGVALRTEDGYNLGSMCIVGFEPRTTFSDDEIKALHKFAVIAVREIELWTSKSQLLRRDLMAESLAMLSEMVQDEDAASRLASSPSNMCAAAVQTVKDTLHADGCAIIDISSSSRVQSHADGLNLHLNRYAPPSSGEASILHILARTDSPSSDASPPATTPWTAEHLTFLADYLSQQRSSSPPGCHSSFEDGDCPSWLPCLLATPDGLSSLSLVPAFAPDGSPVALLVTWSVDVAFEFSDTETTYLHAVGIKLSERTMRTRLLLADKAKSVFISNSSHELRTPLHGLLASVQYLAESNLEDDQRVFLSAISQSAVALRETVDSVLDYTKISTNAQKAGTTTPTQSITSPMDLGFFLEEACDVIYSSYHAASFNSPSSEIGLLYSPLHSPPHPDASSKPQVDCVVHVESVAHGWMIEGDRASLRRVISNLVSNALKYTDRDGGLVQIALRSLVPSARDGTVLAPPASIDLELKVTDTGRGMSEAFLQTGLFAAFSQEDSLSPGTGLGLAITKLIVERMGGTIRVQSKAGVGTQAIVQLTLPLASRPVPSSSSSPAAPSSAAGVAALPSISELSFDSVSPAARTALEHLFQSIEASRLSSSTGARLLIRGESAAPGGASSAEQKVIIMTSDGRRRAGQRGLGGEVFLVKPIGPKSLRNALVAALSPAPPSIPSMSFSEDLRSSPSSSAPPSASRAGLHPLSAPSMHYPLQRDFQEPSRRNSTSLLSLSTSRPSSPPPLQRGRAASLAAPSPALSCLSNSVGDPIAASCPLSVLVIEDCAVNRRILATYLRKKGCVVVEACDGLEGVQAFQSKPPKFFDVILCDVSMPRLSGHDCVRQIRAHEETQRAFWTAGSNPSTESADPPATAIVSSSSKNATSSPPVGRLPIFALTGFSAEEDRIQARDAGMDHFLVKPVSMKDLWNSISSLHLGSGPART